MSEFQHSTGASSNALQEHPLELSGQQFEQLVAEATSYLRSFLDSLPVQPAVQPPQPQEVDGGLEAMYPPMFPSTGQSSDALLGPFFQQLVPSGYNPASPGYLAFIPGGGLPESAVADLISNIINRYLGLRRAAPLLAAIDDTVIGWFCRLVGFPETSGGYLSPGGSLANLTAIVTARHHQLGDDFFQGTLYTSEQTHHSITKAAVHAGIPRRHVRLLPVDATGRLDHEAARQFVERDREQGLKPFLLVSHAGTTNTGAIDDLEAGYRLAQDQGLWWHVDAAYGGFFLLTERGQASMRGIEQADSITMDPHKGLFLPYGTGCLLVRNVQRLLSACDIRGEYMPRDDSPDRLLDACDLSPEQTRDFRGLRIWLPIMLHGIGVFRQNLDEKLDLARQVYETMSGWQRDGQPWQLESPPELSVVAFRLSPPGYSGAELDALNHKLLEEINQDGSVLLSPTVLGGRLAIRLCVLSFRTHREHIDRALGLIQAAGQRLLP